MLCHSIDQALVRYHFNLIAFVIMPEHIHLFVHPKNNACKIDRLLAAIKRPFSYRIKELLIQDQSDLLRKLTSKKNSGKSIFHFWQQGPGYDRNLSTKQAVENAIDYIHLNPVKRKLSKDPTSWKWSSARWYASDRQIVDPDLPQIHGLPWEFFETE